MWLIVGLGNPGSKYDRTPHNLGFDVVEILADRHRMTWQPTPKFKCVAANGSIGIERALLVKPTTYMNLSGEAVRPLADYYKVPNEKILVICDDVNLPYGKIRLRAKGSHGGHNGLRNLIQHLGDDYPRLRIGCASMVEGKPMIDHVLSPIWGDAVELADIARQVSADCAEALLKDTFEKTMAVFNGWDGRPKPD